MTKTKSLWRWRQDYLDGKKTFEMPEELSHYTLIHPPWICQPYVRPPPEVYVKKMEECAAVEGLKRQLSEPVTSSNGLSKKKQKKLERNPNKKFLPSCSGNNKICVLCKVNPGGLKCEYDLCKSKCYNEELDCAGHKIQVKTKREKARNLDRPQQQLQAEVQA
jgi:tRNA-dihydrouridine synthase 1